MCEVAQRFAGWLGLRPTIEEALEYVFARWDGQGIPNVAGEGVPLPMRLLHVARDISLFMSAAGVDKAREVIKERSGGAYEPRLAELAVANLDEMLAELDETRMWELGLDSEPTPLIWLSGDRIDAAFGDDRRRWSGSSRRGCASTRPASPSWRRPPPGAWASTSGSVTSLRRAALAHDLGRVGVSNAIWEKPGPLGFGEWERVRLHPHYTERAFAQSPGAGADRAPRGLTPRAPRRLRLSPRRAAGRRSISRPGSSPPPTPTPRCARRGRTGRRSMRRRPRPSCCARREEGRLDPEAVDAVLDAAGHRVRKATSRAAGRADAARARGARCPRRAVGRTR